MTLSVLTRIRIFRQVFRLKLDVGKLKMGVWVKKWSQRRSYPVGFLYYFQLFLFWIEFWYKHVNCWYMNYLSSSFEIICKSLLIDFMWILWWSCLRCEVVMCCLRCLRCKLLSPCILILLGAHALWAFALMVRAHALFKMWSRDELYA